MLGVKPFLQPSIGTSTSCATRIVSKTSLLPAELANLEEGLTSNQADFCTFAIHTFALGKLTTHQSSEAVRAPLAGMSDYDEWDYDPKPPKRDYDLSSDSNSEKVWNDGCSSSEANPQQSSSDPHANPGAYYDDDWAEQVFSQDAEEVATQSEPSESEPGEPDPAEEAETEVDSQPAGAEPADLPETTKQPEQSNKVKLQEVCYRNFQQNKQLFSLPQFLSRSIQGEPEQIVLKCPPIPKECIRAAVDLPSTEFPAEGPISQEVKESLAQEALLFLKGQPQQKRSSPKAYQAENWLQALCKSLRTSIAGHICPRTPGPVERRSTSSAASNSSPQTKFRWCGLKLLGPRQQKWKTLQQLML